MHNLIRRLKKGLRNVPNLVRGYNIYVDTDKLDSIRFAFSCLDKKSISFADLGGVWKVNAGYTIFALKNYDIKRAVIVDTNYNRIVERKLMSFGNLVKIQGNFGSDDIIAAVGNVDAIFFFDVLLHQVAPDWDEVLSKYSSISDCFVIYNQQYLVGSEAFRLTDLPLERYKELVPERKDDLYDFIYAHKNEINEEHNRPWKDVHNILQWAITDDALRELMGKLGYREVFFKSCGPFSNSDYFENHAFVFIKK